MACDTLKLKQRYEALRSERALEEPIWDDIERYMMPLSGQTAQTVNGASAENKTDPRLWDLTAPLALQHLASSLQGTITNPASKWFAFQWQDDEVEQDHDAVAYREKLAELVWAEIQASDFNMEISRGYLEWAGIGNMHLVCEPTTTGPEWKGVDFTSVPSRQVVFEEDSRGGLLRWWRHLRWTAAQIVDFCANDLDAKGKPKTEAPEKYRDLATKASAAAQKFDVIFCIYRRSDIPETLPTEAIPEERPFGCVHFDLESCAQLGGEGGYYRMPAVLSRFGQRTGTAWGYGLGHVTLGHVKGVNYFKELQLTAGEKAVDPAMGATERVGQQLDLRPGKVSVVPSKEDLWTIDSEARFDVSAELMRDERTEIRRAFHEDDLQLKESPQMTATEVQARRDQMNRALGSPVGRLQTDALSPVVNIILDHLSRAGKLPPAPAIVKRKLAELKLLYLGPIARAQVLDEVVAIEREAAFISNLLQLGFTNAKHYFNLGAAIKEHSKRLGVPATVINSDADAKRAIEAEAAAAQAAMDAKTAKDAGQAMAAAAQAQATAPAAGIGIGAQPSLLPSGGMTP